MTAVKIGLVLYFRNALEDIEKIVIFSSEVFTLSNVFSLIAIENDICQILTCLFMTAVKNIYTNRYETGILAQPATFGCAFCYFSGALWVAVSLPLNQSDENVDFL